MPETRSAPVITPANLEAEKLHLGQEILATSYALSTVMDTFHAYEWFRSQNHDPRWVTSEALFWAAMPQRMWEGTNIPRSSLPVPLTFSQVESALPSVYQAVFNPGQEWFQVEPEATSTLEDARGIQAVLTDVLEHSQNEVNVGAPNEINLAIKSLMIYGNGALALEYDPVTEKPYVQWLDMRELYVNPGTPTPNIDESASTIRRKLMTVEELDALRDHPRMSIPIKEVLSGMANGRPQTQGDVTAKTQDAIRGVNFMPGVSDFAPLPSDRQIEVLIFQNKNKIIWVLNREWVAYNQNNPYGFMTYVVAPCFIVPGKFYAMSYPDMLEPQQRTAEGLLNAHLDEVNLAVHPPRLVKRGNLLTASQMRWRPGMTQQVDNPKEDSIVQFPQGATNNIFQELGWIEASAEKMTGSNSVNQGVPRPGNANRTAAGMQMQAQGGANRLYTIVKNVEDYMIVPMLYKMARMIQFHTRPETMLAGAGPTGATQVPAATFHKPVKFKMLAASRMMTREKLAAIFPMILQYGMAGPFLSQLQKSGKTIDVDELSQMMQDATGIGKLYKLFRPLNEQETQALNQPPPEVVAEQERAKQDSQTRLQMGQMKAQTEIQKELIKKQPDPMQAQMDMQKAQMEIEIQKVKLELEQQKAQMEMVMKQFELKFKEADMRLKTEAAQQSHQIKLQQQQEQGAMQQQQAFTNHAMSVQQSQEQHAAKMDQMKAQGGQKLDQAKEGGRLKLDLAKRAAAQKAKSKPANANVK